MLNKVSSLTKDNENLASSLAEVRYQLAEAQKAIEKAEGVIQELTSEREIIGSKIDAILERLE